MGARDRIYVILGILLAVVPLAVNLFFLVRRRQYVLVSGWRYKFVLAGLVLALAASIPSPLFLFALELPWRAKGAWLPLSAAWSMPAALVAGLVAIVLIGFARDKVRWIGMASAFLSVALLYFIALGLSD